MTTEKFRRIGNRVYDLQRALQMADNRTEVDVLAWAGHSRIASSDIDYRSAMASDTTKPLIIAHSKVIDGLDRLYKALKTGQKTMPAFILSDEQALSVMTIKTAVKRIHPDVAKEIRKQHKGGEDLAHPFYALEKRKPGEKDRTCRECNKTIEGDALYFDRATGDEPWLREKGYICLQHEKEADVEKWVRCPRRECSESVPESEWSKHWRDHSVAASVHRYHFAKVAHCGLCEEDLEIEAPKKRVVEPDGEVVEKTAGDVVPSDVLENKRRMHNLRYPNSERAEQILTETDGEFLRRLRDEGYDDEEEKEEMTDEEFSRQFDIPLDDKESSANINQNIGLTNPQFPDWEPRVDKTNKALTDPMANPSIQYQVDELGTDLARFTGQPRPLDPTIRLQSRNAARSRVHYHTVTDETGENYRSVPCGEHLVPNVRLAATNRRDIETMNNITEEWHDNTTLEHELPEGFQIRRLNTVGDHIVEGTMMRNCLNSGTRMMMGEPVPNPMTGEPFVLPFNDGGGPLIPRDPDKEWGTYQIPRMMRERRQPFFGEEAANGIPAFRFQGPLYSLRTSDGLPKATFFHPMNHRTGEINKLEAHDVYGVNNKELHPKHRYRMYQYMLDNLNNDTTGADGVTIRWGKTYEGELDPSLPEEEISDTEVLSRADLEAKVAEMGAQYDRNETEKVRKTKEKRVAAPVLAHSFGQHAHTYVDETGQNFKTVLCSFGRPEVSPGDFSGWRTASTAREKENRDDLLSLYGDRTTPIHTFADGYGVHRLNTLGDYMVEGHMNRNCLRQYAQHAIDSGNMPADHSVPFEISHFPYVMGATDTDDPYEMVVQDRPWRYTGPFYSMRDDNGISKATFFHPVDRTTKEPNRLVALDVFGINNSELHDRHKRRMYQYMLHNLDTDPSAGVVNIRWGLTNPDATIETPEDELTRSEVLTKADLQQRISELSSKERSPEDSKVALAARAKNFWGWRNGAKRSHKGDCECWEGYERVPGTKPCAPGSCRKKTGPVKKDK